MTGSSSCHDRCAAIFQGRFLCGVAIFMLCSGVLHAVDGSRSTDEYLRRSWGTEQGLSDGRVNAIAQTPDGYLWVGTDRDLLRFDGKHFTSTQPPAGTIDPIAHVLSLNVDRQGVLWIRTSESRLLTYSGGKFVEVMSPAQGEPAVTSATPSNTSGLLATGIWHGLMQLSSGSYRINPLPTDHLYVSIAQTTDNRIWLGTRESGLILWQNGALTPVTEGIPDSKINCLLAAKDATLWVGTDNGLALWDGHSAKPVALSSGMNKLPILAMIQDRNGNLWLGTSRGLVRYNSSGAQWLTGDANDQETAITALLEDREGDIWFGNDQKLERLEDSPFVTYGDAKQVREDRYGAVYVDTRGYVWLAPLSGGPDWVAKGVVHRMLKDGLDKDVVYSLDGQADDIWVGRQKGGLTHLHWTGQSFDAKTWNRTDGLPENTIYTVRVVRDGSVWVGTLTGGASHIFNGHVETLNEHSGLPSNTVSDIEEDSKGAMWFATSNGVSELRPNSHLLSGPPDQLSSANALVLEHDSEGGVWIGTTSGLAYINDGHVRRFAMQELAESAILGLTLDHRDLLWITTPSHVFSIPRASLLSGTGSDAKLKSYGLEDGMRSTEGVQRSRSAVTDPSGRVWILTARGISIALPARLEPPPIAIPHVESLVLDGKPSTSAEVPAGTKRIVFQYTGLALNAPEGIRFRYQLDNFEKTWSEPAAGSSAVYTNLGPGEYRFRVVAANSQGIWNPNESTFTIQVKPFIWQRVEFWTLCVVCLIAGAVYLHRRRTSAIIAQANMRFEERLIERNRIARELHDTLLQGMLSATLYLDVTAHQLDSRSPMQPAIKRVLGIMERLTEDARNAVRGLRTFESQPSTLERAMLELASEIDNADASRFSVLTEGEPRTLKPQIHDEVCGIGREAVINAWRHANPQHVVVHLRYGNDCLTIEIADDGCGMDSKTVLHGREGHWGLTGMRERAERVGARLRIESEIGRGTRVLLIVPARLAFGTEKKSNLPKAIA